VGAAGLAQFLPLSSRIFSQFAADEAKTSQKQKRPKRPSALGYLLPAQFVTRKTRAKQDGPCEQKKIKKIL
jgi:hypothetical protein